MEGPLVPLLLTEWGRPLVSSLSTTDCWEWGGRRPSAVLTYGSTWALPKGWFQVHGGGPAHGNLCIGGSQWITLPRAPLPPDAVNTALEGPLPLLSSLMRVET